MAGDQRTANAVRPIWEVLSSRKAAESLPPELTLLIAACSEGATNGFATLVAGLRCRVGRIAPAAAAPVDASSVIFEIKAVNCGETLEVHVPRKTLLRLSGIVLGGDKDSAYGRPERKLTPLDQSIAGAFVDVFLASIEAALAAQGIAAAFEQPVKRPDVVFDQTEPAPSMGFLATIELLLDELVMPVLLLVPSALLRAPDAGMLSAGVQTPATYPLAVGSGRSDPGVAQTPILLSAVLDACPLTVSEVSELQVGDVLALVAEQAARVRFECDGEPLFWGSLGRQGGAMVVRIEAAIDAESQRHADIEMARTATRHDGRVMVVAGQGAGDEGRT